MVSPYVPHAIYAIAVTSISIHIVNHKRNSEEEMTRLQARTSLLQQIQCELSSTDKPVKWDEVERLKRLARPLAVKEGADGRVLEEVKLSWTDIFYGRKLPKDEGMSERDKKDLEKLKEAFNEKS